MSYSQDHRPPCRKPPAAPSRDKTALPDWHVGFPPRRAVPNLHGYPCHDVSIARRSPLHLGRFVLNRLTYDARGLELVEHIFEGEQVEVRIDLADISSAWIEDPWLGQWFPVRCLQTRYARGVSFAAHLRIVEDYVRSGSMRPPWHEAEVAAGAGFD